MEMEIYDEELAEEAGTDEREEEDEREDGKAANALEEVEPENEPEDDAEEEGEEGRVETTKVQSRDKHRSRSCKVAFLSGVDRRYYPEDSGFSKFSIIYGIKNINYNAPLYAPPLSSLQKPISNKGYSIGGLSAPRFPKLRAPVEDHSVLEELNKPTPSDFQLSIRKQMRRTDTRFVHKVQDSHLRKLKEQQLAHSRNLQCYVSFGSLKSMSRFGQQSLFNLAGVGTYNVVGNEAPRLKINPSFGRSPVLREESTEILCIPSKFDSCFECGRLLDITDYYRTRFTVSAPQPEIRSSLEEDDDSQNERSYTPTKKKTYVCLCNVCFYRAIRGDCKNWSMKKVRWLFKKVRSCACIHNHCDTPQIIHRTDCKTIRRLQRKEAIFNKYFADRVEESIPVKANY